MTNKTLSEQICETCGIEPKIIQDYELNDIELYPDFENNNNNFVKLLELKILTGCTLWGFLSLKGVYMSKKETVLKTIYLILSNKIKFLDDKSREQIKQAIRQADWEV